jgi:DNA mismatch repair protein MutL
LAAGAGSTEGVAEPGEAIAPMVETTSTVATESTTSTVATNPEESAGPVVPPDRISPGREHLKAIQIHDSYLVVETEDGLVVIDQHALHERILYEEFRSRVERGAVESQRLLVPEPVHLTSGDAAAVLEQKETLAALGLEVEPFGGDTVLITGTPAMMRGVDSEGLLRDLADRFRSNPIPPTRDALLEDVLNMLACKAAVKAGQKLAPAEIDALLARRHLARDAHHCPHGRPTALILTTAELERQFGRI